MSSKREPLMKGAADKFLARIPHYLELGSDSLPGVICDLVPASLLLEEWREIGEYWKLDTP